MKQQIKIAGKRIKSHVWEWFIMDGEVTLAGGYASTKLNCLNDARLWLSFNS